MDKAQVVVLAAGRGSRLGQITINQPKAMVNILNKPLFEWLLKTIQVVGLNDPVIITGYKAESFARYNLKTIHNPHWQKTNMVSSLLCARNILRKYPTIITYSDIIFSPDDLSRLLSTTGAPISISYDPNWLELWRKRFENPLEDAENFVLDSCSNVSQIGGTPQNVDDVEGQYMGLLRITPNGWRSIESILGTLSFDYIAQLDITSLLQLAISKYDLEVKAVPISSAWCEIDSSSDIPVAEEAGRNLLMVQTPP